MSGGVDSSVAAWLLREQGHEVIGVFMRHGQDQAPSPPAPLAQAGEGSLLLPAVPIARSGEGSSLSPCAPVARAEKGSCCSAADAADARRVADMLQIPFHTVNFEQEFSRIVDYFIAQYTAGRTPNPCVVCNTWLKFGRLFDYANQLGAEYVATGHYARLTRADDGIALHRGVDPAKDQSYVLFGIERRLLPRLVFPVGEHRKEEIRAMAERLGLRVAAKRDSQEICFVPDQDHARFIRERCATLDTSGDIVTTDGTVVGRHDGYERFTVGQRKGLRLAFGEPRYVVRIEADSHRVVIGEHEELARDELTASEANWLDPHPASTVTSFAAQVKIRYRSQPVDALVEPMAGRRFRVRFDQPCYGVAPGQAAVCYCGDRVLGGGWID